MPGPFCFAWIDEGEAFNPAVHNVEDEQIVDLSISQSEGGFAGLSITVRNPGGLLAPGRQQWCWLSWHDGAALVPLYTGRLVAVPESVDGEAVRLLFSGQPTDFAAIKAALAESLRVLPYYDPVWIAADTDDPDPDGVLTAYSAAWHIDRVSQELTISDILEGEDGTLSIGDGHIYDALELSYAEPPLARVRIKGTLAWTQGGAGTINLTEPIFHAFAYHKTIYTAAPKGGLIVSLTGDGLLNDWPKAGASFGGGWTVSNNVYVAVANPKVYPPYTYDVTYMGFSSSWSAEEDGASTARYFFQAMENYIVKFPVHAIEQFTNFDWKAEKARTEIIEAVLEADIQPLLAEPAGNDAEAAITISAQDTVTEPDGGGDMPIGDTRRKSYLNSDRGAASVQYLFELGRATLRQRARAVEVKFRVPWAVGIGATLRMNAELTDNRLPGGGAVGKIIAYDLTASGTGEMAADITIGCAIGHGGVVSPAVGTPVYAAPGYMQPGYQIVAGADVLNPTADLAYQTLDDFIVSDDGVDLLTLNETTAVQSIEVTNGLNQQIEAVTNSHDPPAALREHFSRICVQLVPVADLAFETVYTPASQPLPIPQQINLAA